MTAVAISQPMLFPWPGFFEQVMLADIYMYLDDVQFSRGSFVNRIQLLIGNKREWMTIPLAGKGSFQKISDLISADDKWKTSHRALLQRSLEGAPYCDDALSIVDVVYQKSSLLELLIASIEEPARYMGIGGQREILRSSDAGVDGTSWRRVLDLVQKVNGTRYLTGHGAARYLDHAAFDDAGISVEYMKYSCTSWRQPGATFTPYVSILDLIARVGPDARSYLVPATTTWQAFLKEQSTAQ